MKTDSSKSLLMRIMFILRVKTNRNVYISYPVDQNDQGALTLVKNEQKN